MKKAPELTAARLREVLHYDPETGVFTKLIQENSRWPAGRAVGGLRDKGYIGIWVDKKCYMAHRLAWLYVHGKWPKDQLDHKNRNKADNRIANLREATNQLNCQNRGLKSTNRSGATGVYWHKQHEKWVASAIRDGRQVHLGLFRTVDEAAAVRNAFVAQHYLFAPKEVQNA